MPARLGKRQPPHDVIPDLSSCPQAKPSQAQSREAVNKAMELVLHFLLRHDRRGTAGIEFALILPLMVLLVLGLADQVRYNLAMMDVDTAAGTGATTALRQGYDRGAIGTAMAAQNDRITIDAIDLVTCAGTAQGNANGNKNGVGAANGNANGHRAQVASNCPTLPPGRYARITASVNSPSLFGAVRPAQVTAVALVRLP